MASRRYLVTLLELTEVFVVILLNVGCVRTKQGIFHLSRQLTKDGFHRDLEVKMSTETKILPDCDFLLVETLPAGVYVDVFQIKQMKEFGGPKIWTPEVIDTEKPEYLSSSHLIYIYLDKHTVHLPVHVRYHRPSLDDSSMVQVEMPLPQLYSSCKGDGNSVSAPCTETSSTECHWTEEAYNTDIRPLIINVPVGQKSHQALVIGVTLTVTWIGGLTLLYYIIKSPLK